MSPFLVHIQKRESVWASLVLTLAHYLKLDDQQATLWRKS
jgi:hypothetical protein